MLFLSFKENVKNQEISFVTGLLVDGAEAERPWAASVNVNILPFPITFLPDTRLLRLVRVSHSGLPVERAS